MGNRGVNTAEENPFLRSLTAAAKNGHVEIVKWLLNAGAVVEISDRLHEVKKIWIESPNR